MVDFYIVQIRLGNITLVDVPTRWRDAVETALNADKKTTD